MHSIISTYIADLNSAIISLNIFEIKCLAEALIITHENGGTIFIAGNGGSASTASHFATDLGIGSLKAPKHVRAIGLTDNVAAITAISNDKNFESVFEQQVQLLGKEGDMLVLISASGNSKNLMSALATSQQIGMSAFSLTGFDGGELRRATLMSNVHVPSNVGDYGLVEDAHLAVCHMVTECIRNK